MININLFVKTAKESFLKKHKNKIGLGILGAVGGIYGIKKLTENSRQKSYTQKGTDGILNSMGAKNGKSNIENLQHLKEVLMKQKD